MHILMKYLMNKFCLLYFTLLSFSFTTECLDTWFSNLSFNNSPFKIKATFNTNDLIAKPIIIFIDKKNSRIKIEYENQNILLFNDRTMKLFKETNQLYIDNPDSSLSHIILSIFERIDNKENYLKISNREYSYITKNFNLNKIYIKYNDACDKIEEIKINAEHQNVFIYDISIHYIDLDNINDIFNISGDYFIYDLRK